MGELINNRVICIDDDQSILDAYEISMLSAEEWEADALEGLDGLDLLSPQPEYTSSRFELSFANQGRQGWELIQASCDKGAPYAVAFIDIRMPPGWDGLKTAQEIRKIDPDIYIVFVTAYSDYTPDQIQAAMNYDAFLLKKPFDADVIRQLARTLCISWDRDYQKHKLEMELYSYSNAADAVITIDDEWLIQGFNPAAEKLFGYRKEELVQQEIGRLLKPEEEVGYQQAFLHYAESGGEQRRLLLEPKELVGCTQGGEEVPLEVSVNPINLKERTHWIMVFRDIRKRKKLDEMRELFISTVNHELRTPLTSIQGALGIVLKRANDGKSGLKSQEIKLLDIAGQNAERLRKLISDVMDVEQISSGKMRYNMGRYRVGPLLERSIAQMEGYAINFGVHLRLDMERLDWGRVIMVDADRFLQLIANLLSNAIKFTPDGGEVVLRLLKEEHQLLFLVQDQGPGVSPEIRDNLFEKFVHYYPPFGRKIEGTGLGLAISREIAHQFHGEVEYLEDATAYGVERGAVFVVSLPIYLSDDRTGEAADGAKPQGREEGAAVLEKQSHTPNILHLDEDAEFAEVVHQALSPLGKVVMVHTLEDAKEYLRVDHYDLVLMDLWTGSGTSMDLLPLIQAQADPALVLLLSGYEVPEGIAAKVDRVLSKENLDGDHLLKVVDGMVQQRANFWDREIDEWQEAPL